MPYINTPAEVVIRKEVVTVFGSSERDTVLTCSGSPDGEFKQYYDVYAIHVIPAESVMTLMALGGPSPKMFLAMREQV